MPKEQKVIRKMLEEEPIQSQQIVVDIGDGRKGIIRIDKNKDPLLEALQFCYLFKLDQKIAGMLWKQIVSKMQQQKNKSQKTLTNSVVFQQKSSTIQQNCTALNRDKRVRSSLGSIDERKYQSKPLLHGKQLIKQTNCSQIKLTPKFNPVSRMIIAGVEKKSIIDNIEIHQKKKRQKIQKLKQEILNKQLSYCSFKPKINPISDKVDKQIHKNNPKKRYEELYNKRPIVYANLSKVKRLSTESNSHPTENRNKPKPDTKTSIQKKSEKENNPTFYTREDNQHQFAKNNTARLLRAIFNSLDRDKDGRITFQDFIRNDDLSDIFRPIVQQLKELKISLESAQFIEAGERITKGLTKIQIGALNQNYLKNTEIVHLLQKKNQDPNLMPEYTFKPGTRRPRSSMLF